MATIIGPSRKIAESEWRGDAWAALGVVGALFLVVGVTDLLLAWVPPRFGNADWEFGTVTAMFNNLPVPAMGVGLALAGSTGAESLVGRRVAAIVAAVLAMWSLIAAVLLGLTLPLALGVVTEAGPRQALVSSSVKTCVQIIAYTAFFVWAVRFALSRKQVG